MKLFANVTHHEGQSSPVNAYLMFGRCYDHGKTESNGFYVRVASPFKPTQLYICPQTFTTKLGPCRSVWRFWTRRYHGTGKLYATHGVVKVPV